MQTQTHFLNFPTCFSIPIFFFNLNSNFSNLASLRNLQEQVKKAFYTIVLLYTMLQNGILLPKLFWPTVRKKCSNDREKLIQTVKDQNNFWQQNAFLTCSWRFLISNNLEQLEFKLGFRNMQEKFEN